MPKVPKRVTDDTIQVRQVSHYQFTWVAGESGASGTWTLQLVLDQGAWEEVVTVDAEDADVLQDLLSTAGDRLLRRRPPDADVRHDGGRQRLRPGPRLPEGGRRPPGPAPRALGARCAPVSGSATARTRSSRPCAHSSRRSAESFSTAMRLGMERRRCSR